VLLALLNVLYGTRYTDLCYGYNAFWRSCLPHMSVNCDGFEVETLITARVARAGLSVVEVPSVEHERLHGVSNLNAVPDGMRVLRTILRERIRRVGGRRWDGNSWQPTFREFPAPANRAVLVERGSCEDRGDAALRPRQRRLRSRGVRAQRTHRAHRRATHPAYAFFTFAS